MKPAQIDDAHLMIRQAVALHAALQSLPEMTTVSLDAYRREDTAREFHTVRMAQVSLQSADAREHVRAAVGTELKAVLAKLRELGVEGTPEDLKKYLESRPAR